MNAYDEIQIMRLVEYILSNCTYNDIDELIVDIGVDTDWFAMFLTEEDED